jgi:hypothetical protein
VNSSFQQLTPATLLPVAQQSWQVKPSKKQVLATTGSLHRLALVNKLTEVRGATCLSVRSWTCRIVDAMLGGAAADKQHREESMIATRYVIVEGESCFVQHNYTDDSAREQLGAYLRPAAGRSPWSQMGFVVPL